MFTDINMEQPRQSERLRNKAKIRAVNRRKLQTSRRRQEERALKKRQDADRKKEAKKRREVEVARKARVEAGRVELAKKRQNLVIANAGKVFIVDKSKDIHDVYVPILRQYQGKSIKVLTLYDERNRGRADNNQEKFNTPKGFGFEVELDVPTSGFGRWWDDVWWKFMADENYGKAPLDYWDALGEVKVVVSTAQRISAKRVSQFFAEGVVNCMLQPIRLWATNILGEAKSDRTRQRYERILRNISRYEELYPDGIPETFIPTICNELQVGIDIDLPFAKESFISHTSMKKFLKTFKFVNPRLNHIDLNEVVITNNYTDVTPKELQAIGKECEEKGDYFDFNRDKNDQYTTIRTLHNKFASTSPYLEAMNEFEKDSGVGNCKLDSIVDSEVSDFIREGTHSNATIDFGCELHDGMKHLDMERAYANFFECKQYDGFVGKVTDFSRIEDFEFIRTHKGFYRVRAFDFSGVADMEVLNKLNCYKGLHVYPSVELVWLADMGAVITISEGCWGTPIDFRFTDAMYEKDDDGIRHYSRWCGIQMKYKDRKSYQMKGDKEYFENMLHHIPEGDGCEVCMYGAENNAVVSYPKKHHLHACHTVGFITAYQRMTVINQLMLMDYNKLGRVVTDGIYYEDHDFEVIKPFVSKDDRKFNNFPSRSYCSGVWVDYECDWDETPVVMTEADVLTSTTPFREHFNKELFLGGGGCGKTHINLTHAGFVRPLYIAPAWKLIRAKQREYGCEIATLSKCFHEVHKQNIKKFNNVLIFDECSQYTQEDKDAIFKEFSCCKLIFCGDIGFQLPPIGVSGRPPPKPMDGEGFDNIQTFKTNYRFDCEKHAGICTEVRRM